MPQAGGEGRLRHAFACLVAASTFFLIIAGGLVTSTGSGLAVPDWPLSYGMLMPPMVGGIFYEHGHRMVAGTVAILTFILMVWLARREPRRWVRSIGYLAFGAVILQALLGGMTVIFLLPTAISVAHATLAQTFFCLTVVLALVTSPRWPRVVGAESGFEATPLQARTAGVDPPLETGAAGKASPLRVEATGKEPHLDAKALRVGPPRMTETDRTTPHLESEAADVVLPPTTETDRGAPHLAARASGVEPTLEARAARTAPTLEAQATGEAPRTDAEAPTGEPRLDTGAPEPPPVDAKTAAAPPTAMPRQPTSHDAPKRRLAACVFAAIYLQLLLGALVRHTESALAIPDFPLAFGGLVPDHWSPQIAIHYVHRVGALVVTILVLALLWRVARWRPRPSGLIGPAAAIGILLPVQIALGAAIVLTGRQVFPGTAHVAVGALLLAASLVLAIRAYLPAWTSAAAGPRAAGTAHALRARPA